MPIIRFMPDGKSIEARSGTTLLDASRRARVAISTRCDGNASCLMCKVEVADQSGLRAPGDKEKLKLGERINDGIRLACQAKVSGDVTVNIPESPLKAAIRLQLERQKEEDRLW